VGTPFMGELKMISWNFAPKGWALANGQLLPINQNQALFSLFGTMYGGDGRVNFALPDMRGRIPIHVGAGFIQGQRGGEAAHTVNLSEMPAHTHFVNADTTLAPADGNLPSPTRRLSGSSGGNLYGSPVNLVAMNPSTISNTGGSQAHDNMAPYLCINFCVALQGVFPSRN
jgi:microcystin-dependent protein